MQSALNSFNFLLRALSEKDDEISSLKKRMQNSHLFGSDRSLDAQADSRGLATPTFARQRPVAATYNVEYLLYGDKYSNGEKMEGQNPPKVLTPPYEFEPHFENLSNSQPKAVPEVQLGLKSI
jgi:hypothetical protein